MSEDRTFVGGAVTARIAGHGPTLVLFHSLLADHTSFDRVRDGLARHFRVVVFSLPGFPGSQAVDGGSLEAVADRMAEAIREAAPRERPVLLGNGYGGFVALSLVLRHPGAVSRLALCDSGAAFSGPGREAFRSMAKAARGQGLAAVADTAMRRLFAPDYHASHAELVEERRARFLGMDLGVFCAACEELAKLDLRSCLAQVSIPVLALVGEQDEATPPVMSQELATLIPGARLLVLPGCAHVPQLQAPEQFLVAVLPFLKQGSAQAGVSG